MLETEPRVSHTLGKCFTTGLHPSQWQDGVMSNLCWGCREKGGHSSQPQHYCLRKSSGDLAGWVHALVSTIVNLIKPSERSLAWGITWIRWAWGRIYKRWSWSILIASPLWAAPSPGRGLGLYKKAKHDPSSEPAANIPPWCLLQVLALTTPNDGLRPKSIS